MATPGAQDQRSGWTVDDSTFGARLALIRMRMGWNMKEAARECAVNGQTWRLWEVEGALPRNIVTVAMTIATRTGCDLNWLLGTDRVRSCAYVEPRILTRTRATSDRDLATTRPVRQTRPIIAAAPRPRSRVAT